MARPRKPTALRLVTGGRTRPHHSKNEPKPAPSTPVPPAWLQGHALVAWNSVTDELVTMSAVCRLDAGVLASWASTQGMIAEAQATWTSMEPTARLLVKNKRGGPSVNPLIGVIRKLQRDAAHYAQLLGLTPSGRAALEVKPPVVDPASKFFA
jgi:P27 family predicted phage terminase small subunit